jgi:hypothetical protein
MRLLRWLGYDPEKAGHRLIAYSGVGILIAAFDAAWQSAHAGNTLQSTSLNRLGAASVISAVCATAPCFIWLSQISDIGGVDREDADFS